MPRDAEFRPDWVSPPGDTIRSILKEKDLSEVDLSKLIECSSDDVHHLLNGRTAINIGLARKLSSALGASVEFWVSRDAQYRQDSAQLRRAEEEWLAQVPLKDMIAFGWLRPVPHASEELNACLDFFGVSGLAEWRSKYRDLDRITAFRTSSAFASSLTSVAAWLRQGEREAEAIECMPWDPENLRASIPYIRALTRQKDPRTFIPLLSECCALSGVAVVIVRAPSGCRASGAVRFLSQRKALIQLSFRYLSDDHFWFTFFHEVGHLLLHSQESIVLEEINASDEKEENEANDFAAKALIPPEYQSALMRLPAKARDIIKFARGVGIAPGIVVGQLQHRGLLGYDHLNSLKRRFTWGSR